MKLRSGITYTNKGIEYPKCIVCQEAWSYKNQNKMCSRCNKAYLTDEEFLKKYCVKYIFRQQLIEYCSWHRNIDLLRDFCYHLWENGMYIDSKFAKTLLRVKGIDSCRKAKYVLPLVIDNWNITVNNGFKDIEHCVFQRDKPVIKKEMSKEKKFYHKLVVYNLIHKDGDVHGYYSRDNVYTTKYDCY
tara:strand:- start:14 stop:574 length:561 start_codon:yes stop_codon:yes gene_type:complete